MNDFKGLRIPGQAAKQRLPAQQMEDKYGLQSRGVKITGATVHFVDEGVDSGPILLQKAVEVKDGDTPKTLQQRVMEEAEWIILPQAVELVSSQICKESCR